MKKLSIKDVTLISLFTALTIVGAYIKIPTPWGVPYSLQFFFALCGGMLLGSVRGGIAQLIYIALGLLGLPVFADGGGIAYVFMPTFGFIIGFAISAFVCGLLAKKILLNNSLRSFAQKIMLFLCAISGMVILYFCGATYYFLMKNLYIGSPISIVVVLTATTFPYLIKDTILCAIAALLCLRLQKVKI